MLRLVPVLLLIAVPAAAGDLGRSLRRLKGDNRAERLEVLEDLAAGRLQAITPAERRRLGRALIAFLLRRHPGNERALALGAIGLLGRPEDYRRLIPLLAGERDDRALAAAEKAFRRAPALLAVDLATRITKARHDPLERAVLLRLMGALPGEEARRRIRLRAAMADDWCPRAAAVKALARDRSPEAVPPLIALLDTGDPALLTAAVESLARLTGRDFGRDPVRWKSWWKTRDRLAPLLPGPTPPPPGDRHRYAHERERKTIAPTYFGIPVTGRKVVFVFDVSASMRYKLPLAGDQLSRAVKGLPSDAMFEVIFFNEQVHPWRGRLSHADPVTKALLVRRLEGIEIKSYTNLFDALARALALAPEEVFVISDGEPNRGRWRLARDILREVGKRNRGRARIHTVSVVRAVDGDAHPALLEALAKSNGGRYVARTLK